RRCGLSPPPIHAVPGAGWSAGQAVAGGENDELAFLQSRPRVALVAVASHILATGQTLEPIHPSPVLIEHPLVVSPGAHRRLDALHHRHDGSVREVSAPGRREHGPIGLWVQGAIVGHAGRPRGPDDVLSGYEVLPVV